MRSQRPLATHPAHALAPTCAFRGVPISRPSGHLALTQGFRPGRVAMADLPLTAPAVKPANPNFSSGPCAKRPGWTVEVLKDALVGRSHRSKPGKARIQKAIDLTRQLLEVPADYLIGIVPASDTGAVEMALWSLLGERPVDMLAWESFGEGWVTDVAKQLKLADARIFEAPYGELPDLTQIDFDRDVVFTWNGTTSGVRVGNADFIPAD